MRADYEEIRALAIAIRDDAQLVANAAGHENITPPDGESNNAFFALAARVRRMKATMSALLIHIAEGSGQ